MTELTQKRCLPCEGGIPALTQEEIKPLAAKTPQWKVSDRELYRAIEFTDFDQTMAFIEQLAAMAKIENHHPDVEFGYNYSRVRYSTHAVGGLTENDFICAAKVDEILAKLGK